MGYIIGAGGAVLFVSMLFLLISKEKSLRRNKGGSCKAKTTGNYGYGRRIASDSRKTGRNVKLTGICTWRAWESFWTSSALLF